MSKVETDRVTAGGVGVMGHGDEEFEAHKRGCMVCRQPGGWLARYSPMYRPHTGDNRCWCVNFNNSTCRIAVEPWLNLSPVEYI